LADGSLFLAHGRSLSCISYVLSSVEAGRAAVAASNSVYWYENDPPQPGPPLDGDVHCDVCIVGAGSTGLWSAHFLAESDPAADIRVLDARHVGAGASGLAGGFLYLAPTKVLRRLLWYYGREKAAGVYKHVARSIVEIGRFCRKYHLAAEYEANGMLQVVTNAKQLARLELQVKRANRSGMGSAFTVLDGPGARELIGSPLVRGGLRTSGAQVNAYKLVRGLAEVVRGQGVKIHEQTPVTEVTRDGDRYRVVTPTGTVHAREVVLATGAWQHAFPEVRSRVMPVWNHVTVTEPLTDEQLSRVAWPGREGVADASSFSLGARLTPDNRVVWTGGRWYYYAGRDTDPAHGVNEAAYRDMRAAFDAFFPAWRDVPFSHAYSGMLDWSRNFIPQFGRTPTGLVYAHGYTGNGLATSHTGGKIVRDLVLRRQTEFSELAFVTVHQTHFFNGRLGDLGVDAFIWRQYLGDKIPLLLPHRAAIAPKAFFASTAARSRPARRERSTVDSA
jgi:glycine/D-amino acid oxidase-like deaminating enzyme